MFSRFPRRVLVSAVLVLTCLYPARAKEGVLSVCADPDNLPFSNSQQQGYENQIATLIARYLHMNLSYVWQRMGPGFVREFLNTGKCDVLIGIPSNFRGVLPTTPYYRSSYMFVVRRNAAFKPASLDDAGLRGIKIGIQALNEEYAPPGEALARRGLQDQIVAFKLLGQEPNAIIDAVATRKIDLAIVWGPSAGYFARNYGIELELLPLIPYFDSPGIPFTFEIGMGVRQDNTALRDRINEALDRRQTEIHKILMNYGIPQLKFTADVQSGG